jgi:acetyl-CoA carboxylase biotin carboxyl carrier protein
MSSSDDPLPTPETELLDAVCGNIVSLLSGASPHPRRIQVRVGTVAVVIEWPQGADAVSAAAPVAAPVTVASAADETGPAEGMEGKDGFCYVRASIVGTFYRASEPGAKPFATEGDLVNPGQQVGILEAMKMMIPVEAEQPGRIARFLVADGAPVESSPSRSQEARR